MFSKELLKGKVALVTGGRSGIGYGIAQQFLELGAKVFICSRKEKQLKIAAEALSEFGECHYHTCDIRKIEEVQVIAEKIKAVYGRLDILVNNAGGQFPALAEYISSNGWAAVINNNLNGTFYVSQTMYNAFFAPQKAGVVVNITANVFRGFPGMAHTGAARAGVENLTKTLAQEWAHSNLRMNCVAPGTIESSGLDKYPDFIKEQFEIGRKENLFGRYGTVEDVANAVTFLASDLAAYISGTTLYVDGCERLSTNRMDIVNSIKAIM